MTLKHIKRTYFTSGSPFRYLRKWARVGYNRLFHWEIYKKDEFLKPPFDEYARRHVKNMQREGFSPATNDFNPELLKELVALYETRISDPDFDSKKLQLRKFMTRVSTDDDLNAENILVRFAMQEKVLAVAAAYLGQVPYLSCVQIFMSHSTEEDGWNESQLWHLDREDSTTVKLWVYLTDVPNLEYGPFTFLDKKSSAKITNTFFPRRLTDKDLMNQGVLNMQQAVLGPKLTSFYVDSSLCYHQGSRVKGANIRAVYEATFVTHSVLYKIYNGIKFQSARKRNTDIILSGMYSNSSC